MELLKTDLQKTHREYYNARATATLLTFGSYPYLSISGKGAPDQANFSESIEAIYTLAYAIKFMCKAEDMDFVVAKMECEWWISGGLEKQHLLIQAAPEDWFWKIKIRVPEFVTLEHLTKARHRVANKKPNLSPGEKVNFETLAIGQCLQVLHVGPYEEETPSVEKIFRSAKAHSLSITGYHTEIYLNDPRKTPSGKLKTILRYQVK